MLTRQSSENGRLLSQGGITPATARIYARALCATQGLAELASVRVNHAHSHMYVRNWL